MVILLFLIFMVVGALLALSGFGYIPDIFGKPLVARWIIGDIGILFMLFPVLMIAQVMTQGGAGARARLSGAGTWVIPPNERASTLAYTWFFVLVTGLLLLALWAGFLTPGQTRVPFWVWLVLGFFAVAAVVMLFETLRLTLSAIRFGYLPLEVQVEGARPGETLRGRLDLPPLSRLRKLTGELCCYRMVRTRSSSRSGHTTTGSTSQTRIWSSLGTFKPHPGQTPGRMGVDLKFDLPASVPHSTWPSGGDVSSTVNFNFPYHRWELRVVGDLPGVDLVRSWEIKIQPGTARATGESKAEETEAARIVAVGTVARAELAAGRTAEGVVWKLQQLGISADDIIAGLRPLVVDTSLPAASHLQQQLATLTRMRTELERGELMILRRRGLR